MPRQTLNKLTDRVVRSLTIKETPYKVADGAGLSISVRPTGKFWVFQYRHQGKRSTVNIGRYPEITLSQAREIRDQLRSMSRHNEDPQNYKKGSDGDLLFSHCTEEFYSIYAKDKSDATLYNTRRYLDDGLLPKIGDMPMHKITAKDLSSAVLHINSEQGASFAKRVAQFMARIGAYAESQGYVNHNPAASIMTFTRDSLPKVAIKSQPAITNPRELGDLLRFIDTVQGKTGFVLRMLSMLFTRPGEMASMRWDTIDLEEMEWHYVSSKDPEIQVVTKMPRQAVEIIDYQKNKKREGDIYVFPAQKPGHHLHKTSISEPLRNNGFKGRAVPHGFRATARTILVERLRWPVELVEMQLGHSVKDYNGRAYNRTHYIEDRADMLQQWADYLERIKVGEDPKQVENEIRSEGHQRGYRQN